MALRITLIWSHGCFCACSGHVLHITNRSIAVLYKKPREYHKNYFLRSRRFVISERLVDLFLQGSAPRHRCTDICTECLWPSGSMAVTLKTQIFVFSGRGRRVVCRSEVHNPLHKEREREPWRVVPTAGPLQEKYVAVIWKPGCETEDLEAALRRKTICPQMFSQFFISGSPSFWTTGVLDHPFVIFSYIFFVFFLIGDWRFTRREPKGTKGNQKGIQREPKGNQETTKMHHKVHQWTISKWSPKLIILETIFHQEAMQKAMQKPSPNKWGQIMKHFENLCNNCWIVRRFFW